MSLLQRLMLICALPIAVCGMLSAPAKAQTRNPATATDDHEQTLKQLLTEVRELRLALQRAAFSNTRFQMLIERLRIEQSHVDSLRRDLENVRNQLSELKAVKPRLEQEIKDAETRLDQVTDPSAHAEFESRIKMMKENLARTAPEEERLRNREAALESEFQSSQARLNELNSQLDALMTEMKAP